MKKLLFWLIMGLVSLLCSDAHAQYLTVTTPSNCIADGSGSPLTSGTMIVIGTDANDNPIPYRAGTAVMSTTAPISRAIVNGALLTSLQLADPASTSPTNVLYRFAIQDNLSKKITLYKQIIVTNNDSGNFNFCKMNPLPFTTQIQFAAAPFSFSGDWNLLGHLSVALSSTFAASLTATTSGGQAFISRSGSTGSDITGIGMGRTTDEVQIAIPAATGHFFTNSDLAAGDFVIRLASLTNRIYLGAGTGAAPVAITNLGLKLYTSSGTLPASITNDTAGGVQVTNNAGQSNRLIDASGNMYVGAGKALILFGGTSGSTSITANPVAGSTSLGIPAANGTIVVDSATQTLSAKTLVGPATGNSINLFPTGCTPQGPTASINGTGAGAAIFTCSLPANTVENGKILHVICSGVHDTGTGNVSLAINLNGQQVVAAVTGTAVTQSFSMEVYILRTGTTTAQTWGLGMNTTGTTQPFSIGLTGLAFTSNETLDCEFNVASGDHITGRVWAPMSVQ